MTDCNCVDTYCQFHAVAAKGILMGNRGILHENRHNTSRHNRLLTWPPVAQDPQRSNALRIHLHNLDIRARRIHHEPDPPDAGTEQLGTIARIGEDYARGRFCCKGGTDLVGCDQRLRLSLSPSDS